MKRSPEIISLSYLENLVKKQEEKEKQKQKQGTDILILDLKYNGKTQLNGMP